MSRLFSLLLFYFGFSVCSCKNGNKPSFTHSVTSINDEIHYEENIIDQSISSTDTLCSIKFSVNGRNNYFFVSRKLQLGIEIRIQPQSDGYVCNIGYHNLYEKDIKHAFVAYQTANFLKISNFEIQQGGRGIDKAYALVPDNGKLVLIADGLTTKERMTFILEMLKDRYHFSKLLFRSVLTDSKNMYVSTCTF